MSDFFVYKQKLESEKLHDESRANKIKNCINDAEYIIFGPLFFLKEESKKRDIAPGGENIPELETEEEAKKSPKM